MKILSIGSDKNLFSEKSEVRQRIIEYGNLVEELHIVVFTKRQSQISNLKSQNFGNVFLYPTNSRSRWFYIFDAYKIAKKLLTKSYLSAPRLRQAGKLKATSHKLQATSYLITCQDSFESGLAGFLIKRKFKIPLQLQIHTDFLSPYFWKESFLNKIRVLIAKFLIFRSDCIRVVSQRIKDSILQATSYKLQANIAVLPIFVDIKKIQEAPITMDLRQKYPQFDFIILIASRLTKEKNIGLAISAMREVVKKHQKTGLVIVGGGPELKNLKSQISNPPEGEPSAPYGAGKTTSQNSNLDKQIIFENWQEKDILISYYKTAGLFLLTSNYEGYGMSAVEAMAAGCPVIMTDVGLAGEVLIDKQNGLVIPAQDRKKLIEAILTIIENPELRRDLANNTKQIIDFWPSKDEYLKKYYDLWANCAKDLLHNKFHGEIFIF